MTHTEGTTTLATVERTLDVVLEDTRHTVVGESLAEFDHSNQPGRHGQILRNVPQAKLLFISGNLSIGSDIRELFVDLR